MIVRSLLSQCAVAWSLGFAAVSGGAAASDQDFGSGGGVFLGYFVDKLALDAAGNVLLAGTHCGSSNDCQMAVTKLDAIGVPAASFGVNEQTLVRFGGNLINSGNAIAVDGVGNVYVGGTTQQDVLAGETADLPSRSWMPTEVWSRPSATAANR